MVTSQGREEIKDAPFVSLFINNLPALGRASPPVIQNYQYLKPNFGPQK